MTMGNERIRLGGWEERRSPEYRKRSREKSDTAPLTVNFYKKASEPKELVEISGASHVSLYDVDEDVSRAIKAMDAFFKKHGGAQTQAA